VSMFYLKCTDQSTWPWAVVQERAPYRVHASPTLPGAFTSSLWCMPGKVLCATFRTRVSGERSAEKAEGSLQNVYIG